MRVAKVVASAVPLVVFMSLSTGAHAALASPAGGVSLVSMPVGAVGVGAGTAGYVLSDSWFGGALSYLVTVGSGTVIVLDPTEATYYSGQFTIHYDSSLLQPSVSGWLGDWGIDGSAPNLPADRAAWATGLQFTIQPPAGSLSTNTTIDPVLGALNVSFDWGSSGHTAETGHFNFYASVMEAKRDLYINYLGSSATPLDGANLYVTSSGINCSLPGEDLVQRCGEPKTDWYRVREVPEPPILSLLGVASVLLTATCRRQRGMSSSTKTNS